MSTVFVTGGTGLLGNNIVRQLVGNEDKVRVLVRATSNLNALNGLDVDRVEGHLLDVESIRRGCRGADRVIHSAGVVRIGWSLAGGMREINVVGTEHVAQVALEEQATMVHVSTVNALAVSDSPNQVHSESDELTGEEVLCNYVITKREADRVIDEYRGRGLNAVTVYPGFMLGPWDWKPSSGRMLLAVGREFTPIAPSGGCSVCDVRDVAAAVISASRSIGRLHHDYVLAGHNMTYFDLWKLMARVAGSSPPVGRMGLPLRTIVGLLSDLGGRLRGQELELNSAMLAMSRQFHYYSSQRAIDELGYQIRPLDDSIQDAWDWFCHQKTGQKTDEV